MPEDGLPDHPGLPRDNPATPEPFRDPAERCGRGVPRSSAGFGRERSGRAVGSRRVSDNPSSRPGTIADWIDGKWYTMPVGRGERAGSLGAGGPGAQRPGSLSGTCGRAPPRESSGPGAARAGVRVRERHGEPPHRRGTDRWKPGPTPPTASPTPGPGSGGGETVPHRGRNTLQPGRVFGVLPARRTGSGLRPGHGRLPPAHSGH